MQVPPYEGDDIWSFTSHDIDPSLDIPELRLSSSTGFFVPNEEVDNSQFVSVSAVPTDIDMHANYGFDQNSAIDYSKEVKHSGKYAEPTVQTMAFETFGSLPPPSKKKRRRENDQIMEASIKFDSSIVENYPSPHPHVTSPSHLSSMHDPRHSHGSSDPHTSHFHHQLSPHHSSTPHNNSGYYHNQDMQDDFVVVDHVPDQQLTPVYPKDYILFLINEFSSIRSEVIQLRSIQYQVLKHEKARIPELKDMIRSLSSRLQILEENLSNIKCQVLLHPFDIHRLFYLQPDINISRIQLELYMNEVNHALSPHEAWKATELVLEEHPFPISLKQKESAPRIVVRLLTGATASITHVGMVEAKVISTAAQGSPKPPEIINASEKMKQGPYHREVDDGSAPYEIGYSAVFDQLNFATGTRMREFCLQFSCKINFGPGKSEMSETDPSPPFVVFTNGNQWNDIEGLLLKWEAFSGGSTTPWCKLANALQRRYIMATMQAPEEPQRPISRNDFNFLYQAKIDPKRVPTPETAVTEKQFMDLWNWLGEGLHRLHVNSKLLKCWTNGYIIGFISRENAKTVLSDRNRGTFIVRFSESAPGRFAVSFAISEYSNIEVGNYLMGPEEARSLPDTVREYANLTAVVRVVEPGMENPTYAASSKDNTFGTLYSKVHPGQTTISGYMKTMISNGK